MPCMVYAGDRDPAYDTAIPNGRFVDLPDLDPVQSAFRCDLVLPHVKAFLTEVNGG